jgi:hypothetical protein
MSKKCPIDKDVNKRMEVISGALIGVAAIAVVETVGITQLDWPLTVSLYSFTISIPLLSLAFLSLMDESGYEYTVGDSWHVGAWLAGTLFSFVGLAAVICHHSFVATVLFAVLSFVGVIVGNIHAAMLREVNKPTSE